MATSTFKSYLMSGSSASSLTKLVDVTSIPELMGDPEVLDATTLSDDAKVYIPGIRDNGGSLEFEANYDYSTYTTLDGMKDTETCFAVWLGASEASGVYTPDGSEGKFSFKGKLVVAPGEMGVNEVRTMKITIIPSTPVEFA